MKLLLIGVSLSLTAEISRLHDFAKTSGVLLSPVYGLVQHQFEH